MRIWMATLMVIWAGPLGAAEYLISGSDLAQLKQTAPKVQVQRHFELTDTYLIEVDQWTLEGKSTDLPSLEANTTVMIDKTIAPNDPHLPEQWYLDNINAHEAWAIQQGSRDVTVAVIGTGVSYYHPDLAANIATNLGETGADANGNDKRFNGFDDDGNGFTDDWRGWNVIAETGDAQDDNGHGTMIAGIIGAEGNNGRGITGVAWRVQLQPVKFMSANGSGSIAGAVAAIEYAIATNVTMIHASWGSATVSRSVKNAIAAAEERGIIFVAGIGSSAGDADEFPAYPACYNLPNIVSVTSTNRFDQLAPYASWGKDNVDIAAPGIDILSTSGDNGYRVISGNSAATAQVTGTLALMFAQDPELTYLDAKTILLESVDQNESLQDKVVSGGRLNAGKALGAL